jgi:spore maturation protein CgeB
VIELLSQAGFAYRGWIANIDVPVAFARRRMTVHVPRRPYTQALPGIPTIRVFEALACGIPLISAPWRDSEGLFRPGRDFLFAADGDEMAAHMRDVLHDSSLAAELQASGLEIIRARHTCAHRVDELLDIVARLGTARTRAELPKEAAE